jgi:hypothetical protein
MAALHPLFGVDDQASGMLLEIKKELPPGFHVYKSSQCGGSECVKERLDFHGFDLGIYKTQK